MIDIYQQPELAQEAQIIAAPTLVKRLPLPLRRLVGDLSNRRRVLLGLDLKADPTEDPSENLNDELKETKKENCSSSAMDKRSTKGDER